jgi:hypothetical protein
MLFGVMIVDRPYNGEAEFLSESESGAELVCKSWRDSAAFRLAIAADGFIRLYCWAP